MQLTVQKYILPTFKENCISKVVRTGSIIIFHLSKLWKAKFFILCDITFLLRLLGEFETDHSMPKKTTCHEIGRKFGFFGENNFGGMGSFMVPKPASDSLVETFSHFTLPSRKD